MPPPIFTNNAHFDFRNPGIVVVHFGAKTTSDPAPEVHTKLVIPVEFYREMVKRMAGQVAQAETDEVLLKVESKDPPTKH